MLLEPTNVELLREIQKAKVRVTTNQVQQDQRTSNVVGAKPFALSAKNAHTSRPPRRTALTWPRLPKRWCLVGTNNQVATTIAPASVIICGITSLL